MAVSACVTNGPVGLGLDHEVAPEVLERERIGGVAAGQREGEPGIERRRVPGHGRRHPRILAPSGS